MVKNMALSLKIHTPYQWVLADLQLTPEDMSVNARLTAVNKSEMHDV